MPLLPQFLQLGESLFAATIFVAVVVKPNQPATPAAGTVAVVAIGTVAIVIEPPYDEPPSAAIPAIDSFFIFITIVIIVSCCAFKPLTWLFRVRHPPTRSA
ncbi:hypothetical protein QUA56_06595 [Microcoleus sp. N3A4]|uniref:hypothetical protein n=1 Tax=Microcoleus sp. N3A4 TaxID=3055379 RepID=UPI002FD1D987